MARNGRDGYNGEWKMIEVIGEMRKEGEREGLRYREEGGDREREGEGERGREREI